MRLPYGTSSFADLRRGGYVYVDKTTFIPALESAEKGRRYLVFLRPRRMGKTLLLSMLEHYYDVPRARAGVEGRERRLRGDRGLWLRELGGEARRIGGGA